tara:strand:- start:1024 stop:1488 length:465 start_codon:yes stop_codon:yes gene_type:complete
MNLELKNIKYSDFASEETNCYRGHLYIDGKKIAIVSNDGRGGCDYFHAEEGVSPTIEREILAYFKTLPNVPCEYIKGGLSHDLESWCGEQVTKFLASKDLKRRLKKGSMIKDGDSLHSWKGFLASDDIKKHYPKAIIFNDLSFDEALTLYMGEA